MHIGESHPLRRHAVEARGRDPLLAIAAEIAPAQVVCHDQDDVGRALRTALERGQDSIAQIAWDVGYRDVPSFARAFKSVTGLTPGAYRERFRAHQG